MNGRIKLEQTREGRLAAVVASLNEQTQERKRNTGVGPDLPDLADYRDKLRPWVKREELMIKLETARQLRKLSSDALEEWMRSLTAEMHELNSRLPDEYQL